MFGVISVAHVSEMWRNVIMERRDSQAFRLSSERDRAMANAHRRIKASPFSNMGLFQGLASILTAWSVSAC